MVPVIGGDTLHNDMAGMKIKQLLSDLEPNVNSQLQWCHNELDGGSTNQSYDC